MDSESEVHGDIQMMLIGQPKANKIYPQTPLQQTVKNEPRLVLLFLVEYTITEQLDK